ncbi:transcription factor IIIC-epsilon subunit [Heterostelium album PN500]|uniref:Transcription factor IIIC-epsilon subunit n=1 Tax=Heterostelium pallidum (strain ATCC 26659 / Pp 5 / PN500) TaxID=670386 RepID=D3B7D4_HETP5|nr:transcription factor IIIC-epsilon subunit [Heterostelium album PN500]EFA82677.1 transcription factor IIIC-epsilon subunit [Heterostelium album PN500]|eukprot:XP_020434794.1 transcription factor IIIC-epsilon subunit [Heterostelium album PN500]
MLYKSLANLTASTSSITNITVNAQGGAGSRQGGNKAATIGVPDWVDTVNDLIYLGYIDCHGNVIYKENNDQSKNVQTTNSNNDVEMKDVQEVVEQSTKVDENDNTTTTITTTTTTTTTTNTSPSGLNDSDRSRLELLKMRFEKEIVNKERDTSTSMGMGSPPPGSGVGGGGGSGNNNESSSSSSSSSDRKQFGDDVEVQMNIQSIKQSIKKQHAKQAPTLDYQRAPKHIVPKNIYYGINMPANVVNDDRALEAVGGLSQITKVFKSSEAEYLQFKHRPNNPNCRPAFGDKLPTCNMLLRIRKNNNQQQTASTSTSTSTTPNTSSPILSSQTSTPISKKQQKQQQQQQQHRQPQQQQSSQQQKSTEQQQQQSFSADIIAIIPSTIKFDGMSDFQYIVRPEEKREAEQYFEVKDEELNVLPTIFSRIDHPQPYYFKTNPLATFIPETHQFTIGTKPSTFASIQVCRFESTDPLPTAKKTIDSIKTVQSMLVSHRVLQQLFEERPCWASVPLKDYYQKRGGSLRYLKILMPFVAYSFVNGPWRLCYLRYGYDPRVDQEARMYQGVDFRLDKEANNSKIRRTFVTPRRGATKLNTFNYQNMESSGTPLLEGYSPPIFDYTFKEIPTQSRYYQLCDFEVPKLKTLCESLTPSPYCTAKSGWFTENDLRLITNEMKLRCGIQPKNTGSSGSTRARSNSGSKSTTPKKGKASQKSKKSQKQQRQQSQQTQSAVTDDEESLYHEDEMSQFMQSGSGIGSPPSPSPSPPPQSQSQLQQIVLSTRREETSTTTTAAAATATVNDTDTESEMHHTDINMHMDMHFPTLKTNEQLEQDAYDILDEERDSEIEGQLDEFESDQEQSDLDEEEENMGDDEDDFNESHYDDDEDHENSFDVEEADNDN